MTIPPVLGALAAAVLLSFAVPAWSAKEPPPSPASAARSLAGTVAKTRALVRTGRFDEALAILRPLSAAHPDHLTIRFQIGSAAVGKSRRPGVPEDERDTLLDEAIAQFRFMLIREPSLVRVRLELAHAFFLKGEDTLAKRHFEHVLAGQPPAGVALNVNRFLSAMRARKRWSVRVGAALAPDTNIGASSDQRIIYVPFGDQLLPFRRNREELTSSGVGILVWGGGEYQYPLDPRWRLRAGGDFSRREYRSDEFDRMVLSAHLGPRWLIGKASEASLLASARQSWLSDEEDYRDLGIRVEGRHRLNRRATAFLNTARHERRYEERTHLDGSVTDISAGIGWVATPTMRVDTAVGWGRDRTEQKRFRHSRRWVRVGTTVALPWGFTVGGAVTLRWSEYEGNWFPFTTDGSPRHDVTRSLRLNLHNRAITVAGFSPRVSAVQEQRTSNAQLQEYERLSGELSFVRLF